MGKLEDQYPGDLADITTIKDKGTIVRDKHEDGVRFVILRSNFSWCAYVGVPLDHPLAGQDYDNLPLDCHGGLTYAGEGGKMLPEGYYWYGWDYSHLGDYTWYEQTMPHQGKDHKWTISEVEEDSWSAKYNFKKLMQLAERIHGK